ncbi:hypothetical protein MRX96_010145 [Rhipicephalus microplus]
MDRVTTRRVLLSITAHSDGALFGWRRSYTYHTAPFLARTTHMNALARLPPQRRNVERIRISRQTCAAHGANDAAAAARGETRVTSEHDEPATVYRSAIRSGTTQSHSSRHATTAQSPLSIALALVDPT